MSEIGPVCLHWTGYKGHTYVCHLGSAYRLESDDPLLSLKLALPIYTYTEAFMLVSTPESVALTTFTS